MSPNCPNCGEPKYCKPCSQPTPTSHVQKTSLLLREWLTLITCMPWYHSHQQKPDVECQYGVVEFVAAEPSGNASRDRELISDELQCSSWMKSWKYTLRLTIKGFNKFQDGSSELSVYPMDVLADIVDKYSAFPNLQKALSDRGIKVNRFFDVTALVKESDGCCWENQAQMNIEICLKRKVSMSHQQVKEICIKFCEGEVECPEPQEDC